MSDKTELLKKYKNLHLADHPLVRTKISLVRDRKTDGRTFRALLFELGLYVGFEATSFLTTKVERNVLWY